MLMSCSARSKVSHMTRASNREYGSRMLNIARGEVAKNAPQERFLYAPADDAPKKSRSKDRDFLLRHPLRGGLARRAAHSCSPRGEGAFS